MKKLTLPSLLLLPATLLAAPTASWTVESFSQFDQGDATAAFVSSQGELRPGFKTNATKLSGAGVWAALPQSDGSILVGSDEKGALLRVKGADVKTITSIPGAFAVVALAQLSPGVVAAATMPGNAIWRVDTATGKASKLVELKDVETVWTLAAGKNGALYAGTGPAGKLFAISGNTAKEIYDSEDKRITAMTVAPDGSLWFGTSERAVVLRYDGKSVRAMADFAGNEISAIAADSNGVVVAANDISDPPSALGKTPAEIEAADKPTALKGAAAKMPEVGTKPGAEKEKAASETVRRNARKGKGAVFRISAEGDLTQLHATPNAYIAALALAPDGTVYAGSAEKGRVYAIEPDGTVATAVDLDERAVSQLFWVGNDLTIATDDNAMIYRLAGKASDGNYVSDIFDAKAVAKFGRARFMAKGRVTFETRSGNTAKPDKAWSEWTSLANAETHGPAGAGMRSGKVSSPAGRYLQFRLALGDKDASAKQINIYYAAQNQPTTLEDVMVDPPSKENGVTLRDTADKARSPNIKIKWKIDNADGDETSYTVEIQRSDEPAWRLLNTGKSPLTSTSWDWNTEAYPDGWYRARVTASDDKLNGKAAALVSKRVSNLFAVDNTRPTVRNLTVRGDGVTFTAADDLSPLTEMSYSIDDGAWQLAPSEDGIFDDQAERFAIALDRGLGKGMHSVSVRVADAAGNVGAASTTFVK